MGSKGDTLEADLLKLLFNATAIANIADNAAGSPLTNLYVSLHTSSVGEAGNQNTNEVAYTSYARVAVARTSGGWTISGTAPTQVVNAGTVTFPTCTGGSAVATDFAIGTAASGTGKVLYYGTLANPVTIGLGNPVPSFAASALTATED